MQFFIISSYESLNNLPVRSLLIPETDDVEESARNAKDVNKILSYIRILIVLLAVLTTSLLHLLYSEYISSNQILIITLSSITSILYLFLLNFFFKLIPDRFLKKFIFVAKIVKFLSSKFIFNGNSNHKDEDNNGSDELEVFEAAGLSVDNEEMEMIKGILKMDVVKVREIMKPSVDLVAMKKILI